MKTFQIITLLWGLAAAVVTGGAADQTRRDAGMDPEKLDAAFEFIQGSTRNGGLLVVRNGWLAYERYFGLGHREATPNLASCGKSFTSIAIGILIAERPDLFPEGLDQRIFTPEYFPPEAFPLSDMRKKEIKLGQLLAFSAGIRGNNPAVVEGKTTAIDPIGPDGWQGLVDAFALEPARKRGQTLMSVVDTRRGGQANCGRADVRWRRGSFSRSQTLACDPFIVPVRP